MYLSRSFLAFSKSSYILKVSSSTLVFYQTVRLFTLNCSCNLYVVPSSFLVSLLTAWTFSGFVFFWRYSSCNNVLKLGSTDPKSIYIKFLLLSPQFPQKSCLQMHDNGILYDLLGVNVTLPPAVEFVISGDSTNGLRLQDSSSGVGRSPLQDVIEEKICAGGVTLMQADEFSSFLPSLCLSPHCPAETLILTFSGNMSEGTTPSLSRLLSPHWSLLGLKWQ